MADRSSSKRSTEGQTTPSGTTDAGSGEAPGLGEQLGRTRAAFTGLIRSHVDLAKAEFGEIGGEIKKAAALGGIALFLLFMASGLLVLGSLLFAGEALFGSIGWGVLDGTELLLAIGVLLVLAIVDLGPARAAASLLVAIGVGLVVACILVADWQGISAQYSSLPGPTLPAILAGAAAIGLLGAVLASSFGRGPTAASFALGLICGALIGWLASAGPGPRVASALGVAAALLFWPIVASVIVFRHGVDTEKLKARFLPIQTIETTKETIEWVREQLPHAPKS